MLDLIIEYRIAIGILATGVIAIMLCGLNEWLSGRKKRMNDREARIRAMNREHKSYDREEG